MSGQAARRMSVRGFFPLSLNILPAMKWQAILVLYGHFVASQIVQIAFEFLTGLCRLGAVSFFICPSSETCETRK